MNWQIVYYVLFVLSFFFGITVGFMVAISFITKRIMKNINTKTDENYEKIDDEIKAKVNIKITDCYNYYKKLQEIRQKNSILIFSKKKPVKIDEVKDFKWLFTQTAEIFYPDSKEPVLELSVKEVFELIKRITVRLDDIFIATKLTFVRYLKLSVVYMILGIYNKISTVTKHKMMQFALRFVNFSILISNIFSPVSWIKRITSKKISNNLTFFLIENTCKIVGKETACIYSKNINNSDSTELVVIPATAETLKNN